MRYFEDRNKYKKRTRSNVSKAYKKTKHKHQYRPCILVLPSLFCENRYNVSNATYCITCGKVGEAKMVYSKRGNSFKDRSSIDLYQKELLKNRDKKFFDEYEDTNLIKEKVPIYFASHEDDNLLNLKSY